MNALIRIVLAWLALFAIAAGTLGVSGCTDKEKPNRDLVTYKIRLNIDENSLDDKVLKTLAMRINKGLLVSHNKLSKEFHELHAIETTPQEVSALVSQASKGLKNVDYFKRKKIYESRTQQSHFLVQNKIQSYMETSFNLMVNRHAEDGQTYENNNYVVIVEGNHVLPGKMLKVQGEWVLYGIESTDKDQAIRDFGPASKLEYGKIRVVDASFFMLIELYKNYLLSPTSNADSAIEATALFYGIDIQNYGSARTKGLRSSNWILTEKCSAHDSPFEFACIPVNPCPINGQDDPCPDPHHYDSDVMARPNPLSKMDEDDHLR